jgi:hypothetical protein
MAVPWLRRLVAGLSLLRPGFALRSVRVGFVVDKVTFGQVLCLGSLFFPCQYDSNATLHTNISPEEPTVSPLVAALCLVNPLLRSTKEFVLKF